MGHLLVPPKTEVIGSNKADDGSRAPCLTSRLIMEVKMQTWSMRPTGRLFSWFAFA